VPAFRWGTGDRTVRHINLTSLRAAAQWPFLSPRAHEIGDR